MNETIKVVAFEKDSPDIPRAWGEGQTLAIAELNCEIAIRKKVINKLQSGNRFACVGNYFYTKEKQSTEKGDKYGQTRSNKNY
jgi:hypothetical protein